MNLFEILKKMNYPTLILASLSLFISAVTLERRIIGGHDANKVYPFMAGIFSGNYFVCGGSLIKPNVVLTAGHCLTEQVNNYNLYFNTDTIDYDVLKQLRKYKIEKYVVHPDFARVRGLAVFNDITIAKLSEEVKDVTPINLDLANDLNGIETATVIGWGRISEETRKTSNKLQEIELTIWDSKICYEASIADAETLDHKLKDKILNLIKTTSKEKRICTVGISDQESGASIFDSGSPFFIESDNKYYQLGVVSSGITPPPTLGYFSRISIFSNVTAFKDFIDQSLVSLL